MLDDIQQYKMVAIPADELTTTELVNELASLSPGEEVEAYRARFTGERGQNAGGNAAELLYFPHRGRGGIGWEGEVIWTDASSAEEMMDRYLDHDILEDDSPES